MNRRLRGMRGSPLVDTRGRMIPRGALVADFGPTTLPGLMSWWDAFDADQRTLGGSGGTQLVALGDKGPAAIALASVAAPTNGVPMGTWPIAGVTVPLPGPLPAVSPRRVLEGSAVFALGDCTIVACIPLGTVSSDAHYWTYSHGTIPVVRVALVCSSAPSAGRVGLVFGSGIGPSGVITGNLVFDGGNGPNAHAYVVATMAVGSGAITLDIWYDLDTGAGLQHPATVNATGYTGTPVEYASAGGRRNTTDIWAGADARFHTVSTYGRVLTPAELERLRRWWFTERLGWAFT